MIPGELFPADGDIELNAGRPTVTLTIANTGDRPIQVGSHYHFYETNAALQFDRGKARGFRLDIPAGTATRYGRIYGIGKAGNPDIQPGVDIVIGPGTEIIAGEGRIVTAGGIDSHIHFICPQLAEEALYSGMTTMLGGGTGPAAGTAATTCTPGPWHLARIIQAAEGIPVNLGFFGKGNASEPRALVEMIEG